MLLNGADWVVCPQAKDRELIWVGRASMLALLLLACWLAVTFLTKPTEAAVAERFRAAVRAEGRDVGKGVLYTALASFAIFFMMWLVGFVIFR